MNCSKWPTIHNPTVCMPAEQAYKIDDPMTPKCILSTSTPLATTQAIQMTSQSGSATKQAMDPVLVCLISFLLINLILAYGSV